MIANEQNFRKIVSGNDAVPSQIIVEILASLISHHKFRISGAL
jgi:hypothetical protein